MNGGLFFKFIFDCWHWRTTLSISFHVLSRVFLSVDIFCGLHASESAPCNFENIEDMFFVCCIRVRLDAILNLSMLYELCFGVLFVYSVILQMCIVSFFFSLPMISDSLKWRFSLLLLCGCLWHNVARSFSYKFVFTELSSVVFFCFSFVLFTFIITCTRDTKIYTRSLALSFSVYILCGIIYMCIYIRGVIVFVSSLFFFFFVLSVV